MSESNTISEEFARHLGDTQTLDTTETFNRVLQTRDTAWQMIADRLPMQEDTHCADIAQFDDLQGQPLGRMRNFTGPKCHVDWIVLSNIGNPVNTFTNIHLTCWVEGAIDVPHLGVAFGTLPDVFFYADLMPRYELVAHPDHCMRYYDPLNRDYLEFGKALRAAGYTELVPEMPFIRSSLSPCRLASITSLDFFIEYAEPAILKLVEHWIGLVEAAEPIADAATRDALTARDTLQRRNIVYLDPANPIAEKLVGKPAADRLIRILAGEERSTTD